ncbi:MAG: hypothetical protein EXR70_08545 [Deltaproteobacteria bacterium]|nr:hypothetical protein [Deltaproteobacteria bacterium]
MQTLQVTLWLYAAALSRAGQCLSKNWVVSLAPLAYGIILTVVGTIVAPLGFIGGMLYSLASQACASSALFLIKNLLDSGRANVNDFLSGFTVYIWELITIGFILWIPMRVVAVGFASAANGALLYLLFKLAVYIILNAAPELIYQSRTTGLELIGASYQFIVDNWIEWLVPNLIFGVAGFYLFDVFESYLLALPVILQLFLYAFVLGAALTYFMTFRGFLFAELQGTTRRSRLYRYNTR